MGTFIDELCKYFFIWAWFAYNTYRYLTHDDVDLRLDRVEQWLMSLRTTGKDRSLAGMLFVTEGQTEDNIVFRRNLFWMTRATYLCLALPNLVMITWGISCIYTVEPYGVGFMLVFISTAAGALLYGGCFWRKLGWRMTSEILLCFLLAFASVIAYSIAVVFVDPAVWVGGEEIDFCALTMVFATLNMIPNIAETFAADHQIARAMKQLAASVNLAAKRAQGNFAAGSSFLSGAAKKNQPASGFHVLLAGCYSITGAIPAFKHADAMASAAGNTTAAAARAKSSKRNFRLKYGVLLLYVLVAGFATSWGVLAMINTAAFVLMDMIHAMLARGRVSWTPGYTVMLMCLGRVFVASGAGPYWLFGYSAAYAVYGIALGKEVVFARLPFLSKAQAGAVVFFGHEPKAATLGNGRDPNDFSGMPEVALGIFSFVFLFVILVAAYTKPAALPLPLFDIFGNMWPIYVFGVLAFLAVMIVTLSEATTRAFYLARQNLLRGAAKSVFMVNVAVRVPIILAALTYITLVCAGLFCWASADSAAMFIVALFGPVIVLLLAHSKSEWKRNNCNLVVWPPVDKVAPPDAEESDAEVAYGMFQDLIGTEPAPAQGGLSSALDHDPNSERTSHGPATLANFSLPPLEQTQAADIGDIKMPMLPPKSTLRKKRAAAQTSSEASALNPVRDGEGDMFDALPDDDDGFGANDGSTVDWERGDAELGDDATNDVPTTALRVKRKRRFDIGLRSLREEYRNDESGEINPITRCAYFTTIVKAFFSLCGRKIRQLKKLVVGKVSRACSCCKGLPCCKKCCTKNFPRVSDSANDGGDDGDVEGIRSVGSDDGDEGADRALLGSSLNDKFDLTEEDWSEVPFLEAVVCGCLLREEYNALGAWFGSLGLIVLMGTILSWASSPSYYGNLLWSVLVSTALTIAPVIKYFNVYKVTSDMKVCWVVGYLLLYAQFSVTFCTVLNAWGENQAGELKFYHALTQTGTLWLFDAALYYPMCTVAMVQFLRWADNGWRMTPLDRDGDGVVEIHERLMAIRLTPILLVMAAFFNFQVRFVRLEATKHCLNFRV